MTMSWLHGAIQFKRMEQREQRMAKNRQAAQRSREVSIWKMILEGGENKIIKKSPGKKTREIK